MVSLVVPGTARVPPCPDGDCPYVPCMSDGSIVTEFLAVFPHFFCQILYEKGRRHGENKQQHPTTRGCGSERDISDTQSPTFVGSWFVHMFPR